MYNLSHACNHSRRTWASRNSHKLLEGEAIKFVYRRTACRSLAFPVFHIFTRVVRVQLSLLDEAVVHRVNNFKLFARQSHLVIYWVDRDYQNISYSSTRISKLTVICFFSQIAFFQ